MKKLIVIRYAELSTKKSNIKQFLNKLKENITFALEGIDFTLYFDKGRMFIETTEYETVLDKLQYVPGIQGIILAYEVNTNTDEIKDSIITLLKEKSFKTFKVSTKRSDKSFEYDSMEFSRLLGGHILKNIDGLSVDVHNPELEVKVEIRKTSTYIYLDEIKGLGGYPVGSNGKGMLMLSGGIDSPVAGYLAIKRGIRLDALYFAAPPHTSMDAQKKVEDLARILSKYNNNINLHIINLTEIEETIYKEIPRDYLITILRRMMYRIGEILAYKNKCKCLVNGESVGQVASQTLSSMTVINNVVKIPVLRPVVCFDKTEIIDLSKKINTYDISILPFIDCCTIFVPKHPVINPELDICEEYEKLIDVDGLIKRAIESEEVIKIRSEKENKYSDLL
ncbi:MAG: tRNA 4-thiouridine(8) synthase ThiI [Firmicutes bacterium]|nr:tRNA 4-thiouridine(8) synthase ThiI [Bacillota bacterium]